MQNRLPWERKRCGDIRAQITEVLGEESVRELTDASEGILMFASGGCEVEGPLSKVKKQLGAEEVGTDEFRFGQLGQFYKKRSLKGHNIQKAGINCQQGATGDALSFLLKGIKKGRKKHHIEVLSSINELLSVQRSGHPLPLLLAICLSLYQAMV